MGGQGYVNQFQQQENRVLFCTIFVSCPSLRVPPVCNIHWFIYISDKGAQAWDFRSLGFSWFLHHKAFLGLWVTLGLNIVTLNFWGTRHHLICDAQFLTRTLIARGISSWRARSVHASVSYAHVQHALKTLFKFGIFTLMLSIRIRNWWVCSGYASVPDPYAQGVRVRISHWCACSTFFEGTALLKIRLSIRLINFAAPNEPIWTNIF